MAHCCRKFFEAIPKERRKKINLLDFNSEQKLSPPKEGVIDNDTLIPTEEGVSLCNRLFFLECQYKNLSAQERKDKRLEKEPAVWKEFWS